MKDNEKNKFEDDGHTVADMSEISRPPLLGGLGSRRKKRKNGEWNIDPSTGEEFFTPEERRWYVLGALKSALMIALVFLAGLGIGILILQLIWNLG